MPARIFINNWDTYVSQAVFTEFRNDEPNEEGEVDEGNTNLIYGSYITKDSSIKPPGVKKMLKVSYQFCDRFRDVTFFNLCIAFETAAGRQIHF